MGIENLKIEEKNTVNIFTEASEQGLELPDYKEPQNPNVNRTTMDIKKASYRIKGVRY
jgi:hypothetical protein